MRVALLSFALTLGLLLAGSYVWSLLLQGVISEPEVTQQVRHPSSPRQLADLSIPARQTSLTPADPVAELATTPVLRPPTTTEEPREPAGRRAEPRGIVVGSEDDDVSPAVREAFADAVADLGIDDVLQPSLARAEAPAEPDVELPDITALPAEIREVLPELSYDSHMYGGSRERWIRLNGRTLREGEAIGDLRVIAIEASYTIFGFQNEMFRVEALQDIAGF